MDTMSISQQVYDCLLMVPRGKVVTYKQLADVAGTHARVIGGILHRNPDPERYPCHRVIKSDGSIASGFAFGGPGVQQQLLEVEGIIFDARGRIALQKFGWDLKISK